MSDYICPYNCSYRTNSGYCGYTGGYNACQYRTVYRGDAYNAIEAERINYLDGILSDRYKEGFHDGLKRTLQILGGLQDVVED